jgi:hypothetical protein
LELIKFFLFINCDLRLESPLLNIRIKKNYSLNKNNELFLYSYGLSLNYLTYPIKNLGNSILKFINFLEGKQRFACDFFFKYFYTFNYVSNSYNFYNNTIFFLGNSIIFRKDSKSFLYSFFEFFKNKYSFFSFNLINSYLGFYSYSNLVIDSNKSNNNNIGLYYLLSNDINNINKNKEAFLIYQSFIKNILYFNANLIFSSTSFYEFDSIYINLEGRYRFIKQVIKPFENTYTDWEIISLLNIFNKKKQIIKTNYFLQFYKLTKYFLNIIDYHCNFFLSIKTFLIELFYNLGSNLNTKNKLYSISIIYNKIKCKFFNNVFHGFINNYYISDFYTKNSKIMSFSSLTKYRVFKLNLN